MEILLHLSDVRVTCKENEPLLIALCSFLWFFCLKLWPMPPLILYACKLWITILYIASEISGKNLSPTATHQMGRKWFWSSLVSWQEKSSAHQKGWDKLVIFMVSKPIPKLFWGILKISIVHTYVFKKDSTCHCLPSN